MRTGDRQGLAHAAAHRPVRRRRIVGDAFLDTGHDPSVQKRRNNTMPPFWAIRRIPYDESAFRAASCWSDGAGTPPIRVMSMTTRSKRATSQRSGASTVAMFSERSG
ncbi:hypothetical protein GCM10029978_014790 [Actinoallomurus acanthiterrae]